MAIPKLALIPSGVADNQVFSVLPSNGDGDFDFVRGSTATRVNSQGLIETVSNDLPRLNYPLLDGVVQECPSLLLEDEATNLVTYSEDFSQSYWTKGGATISLTGISPNGSIASLITEDTTTGEHRIYHNNISVASGVSYTNTFYIKSNGRSKIRLSYYGFNNYEPKFDFVKNQLISSTGGNAPSISSENVGNDWYRVSITDTTNQTQLRGIISLMRDDNSFIYSGDGTSGVYIYGAMLEQGSFPTSYIPTNGEANGVTRLAETCNGAGTSDTFNDSSGVLMIETSGLADDGTVRRIGIGDNRTYNVDRMSIGYTNSNNDIQFFLKVNGVNQFSELFTVSNIKENNKVAFKYGLNSCSFWINGIKVGENLTNDIFSVDIINYLNFNSYNSFNPFYGNTKQIQYFDTTDIDLEQLTSWVSFQEMAQSQLYSIQ